MLVPRSMNTPNRGLLEQRPQNSPAGEYYHPTGTPYKGPGKSMSSVVAPPLLLQKEQQKAAGANIPSTPSGKAGGPNPSDRASFAPSSNASTNNFSNNFESGHSQPGDRGAAPQNQNRQGAITPSPARVQLRHTGEQSPADIQRTPGRIIQPQNPPVRRDEVKGASVKQQMSQPMPGSAQKPGMVTEQSRSRPNNEVAKTEPPKNPADEIGHFVVVNGAMIDKSAEFPNGRYKVLRQLGSGTYGKVVLCEDNKYHGAKVAVKLVRTQHLYRVSAKNEIKILRELDGHNCTVKLLRDFEHKGHVSMSFELLGTSLDNVCRDKPMKREHVRDVAMQLLQAISYSHSKNIIHSDVKSENVLAVSQSEHAMIIKLVDFGSALFSSAWHPPLVGTMHYRAPEAVLQAGWSFGIDIWAVACIIVELVIGKQIFELAHDDVHLMMMERLLGPIPGELIRKGFANANQYNRGLIVRDARGNVRLAPCRPEGAAQVQKVGRLQEYIKDQQLLDLLRRMLMYNPDERITARDALLHPFFEVSCVDSDDEIDVEQETSPGKQPPAIKMPTPSRSAAHTSNWKLESSDAYMDSDTPTSGLSRASTASIICGPPRPASPKDSESDQLAPEIRQPLSNGAPAPGLLFQDKNHESLGSAARPQQATRTEVRL